MYLKTVSNLSGRSALAVFIRQRKQCVRYEGRRKDLSREGLFISLLTGGRKEPSTDGTFPPEKSYKILSFLQWCRIPQKMYRPEVLCLTTILNPLLSATTSALKYIDLKTKTKLFFLVRWILCSNPGWQVLSAVFVTTRRVRPLVLSGRIHQRFGLGEHPFHQQWGIWWHRCRAERELAFKTDLSMRLLSKKWIAKGVLILIFTDTFQSFVRVLEVCRHKCSLLLSNKKAWEEAYRGLHDLFKMQIAGSQFFIGDLTDWLLDVCFYKTGGGGVAHEMNSGKTSLLVYKVRCDLVLYQ